MPLLVKAVSEGIGNMSAEEMLEFDNQMETQTGRRPFAGCYRLAVTPGVKVAVFLLATIEIFMLHPWS